jgi:glycosyltransferase involved in cell wall biosynthesis
MTALLDLQGVQSRTFGERGVARYLTELAGALERWFPEAVERYLVPDLSSSHALDQLPPRHRLATIGDSFPVADTYHAGSVFEPDVSLDGIWPPGARRLRLAVTLYDLIPQVFPEIYLAAPRTRLWYRTRLQLVRRADRVLAISQTTATDAIRLLGLAPERVTVVGAAPGTRFTRPVSADAAFADVREAFPSLSRGFVLYTGGIEPRKNIDRLLEAYAGLAEELRRRHQLVIVCRVLPDDRARIEEGLQRLGVADRVLFTGYVTDEQLVALYRSAGLFVFPSLYEGYGLPVAEAVACGAPVVASDSSSLVELVRTPEARFDPTDVGAIRTALERALTDPSLLERLREPRSYSIDSWRDVAARTVSVYEELAERPRPSRRPRRRPRVAYVSPLPPQRSGVADYSYRLLEPLAELCDVDAFVDRALGEQRAPEGVRVAGISRFPIVERLRAGYDRVLICLGNSEHHVAALHLLLRRGGTVLAHDVRLSGMYGWASAHRPELEPRTPAQIVTDMYREKVYVVPEDPAASDVLLSREAIAAAEAFVVHSEHAADLARAEAGAADRHKIRVAPFAFRDPAEFPPAAALDAPPIVATFGVVGSAKQTDKLVEAFALVAARRECRLVVAGPEAGPNEYERLQAQVDRLGLTGRARLVGYLEGDAFDRLVAQTTVAVQLRSVSMGETSASVADCLAAGVATVVSAVGSSRELPDEVAAKVEPDVRVPALAEAIDALLDDARRRARLGAAARALARERSFEQAARFVYEELVRPTAQAA